MVANDGRARSGTGRGPALRSVLVGGAALLVVLAVDVGPAAASPVGTVSVLAPSAAAGQYAALGAAFGPQDFDVQGAAYLVNDGVAAGGIGTTSDGCEPFVGAPAGGVAIVDRGICNFDDKVLQAQAAGAIGVIVVNNVSDPIGAMGGDATTVTIPSLHVSQSDGNVLKAGLPLVARLVGMSDSDNDRTADVDDNCPGIANADQADLDGDDLGDLCDDDRDGDGVLDAADACPAASGEAQNGCPLPTNQAECRRDGWKGYGTTFRNQGQCDRYVRTGRL